MSSKPPQSNSNIKGRNLVEEPSYKGAVDAIGGQQHIDSVIEAIIDGLYRRPEGFDLIPGHEPIRIAKTDRVERNDGSVIPAVRLRFVIINSKTIKLLHIEEVPETPSS